MAEETITEAAGTTVEEKAEVVETPPAEPAPLVEEEPKKPAEVAAEAPEAVHVAIPQSTSFKEESNVVADLEDPEKKALDELKQLIQEALTKNAFALPPPPPAAPEEPPAKAEEEAKAEETTVKTEGEDPAAAVPVEEPAKLEEVQPPQSEVAAEGEAPPSETPVPPKTKFLEGLTMNIKRMLTVHPRSHSQVEPPKPEAAEEPASASKEEEAPPKPEAAAEEPAPSSKEEEAPSKPEAAAAEEPAPASKEEEASVPSSSEDKAIVVDEDGAKTVEAIEETIVPVATTPPPPPVEEEEVTLAEATEPAPPPEEVFIWGVPLVGDDKSDTVLLKFLRARDFKVKDALTMIKNAVIWRKQFGIDELLEEDLGVAAELEEKVVFMHGYDKEGHPVCYNVYGELQDKELYAKAFGDEEKRGKFLKWRIQFLEKGIRQMLDFSPGSICTMVQVTDLKNVPGPGKKELRVATNQALTLLQDSYPEFVAKQIFINVPWWYLAYNRTIGSIFTPRAKSKFVFAGPSSSSETLFKYIAPEQVPVQYGGLSKEDPDFTTADAVTEVTIKPASKHTIEIPVTEACLLVWEFRVLGWEVSYGAEFVPTAEEGYTVIVVKTKKFAVTDEPVVKNIFKIGEPGKVVLSIDNTTSKKKKLLYRSKVKDSTA